MPFLTNPQVWSQNLQESLKEAFLLCKIVRLTSMPHCTQWCKFMSKNLIFAPEILRGGREANARRRCNKKARDFTDFLTQKSTPLSISAYFQRSGIGCMPLSYELLRIFAIPQVSHAVCVVDILCCKFKCICLNMLLVNRFLWGC